MEKLFSMWERESAAGRLALTHSHGPAGVGRQYGDDGQGTVPG